jgi:hypothetical protein
VNFVTQNLVAPFGLPAAYLYRVNRFSEGVQQYGVEACGAEALPFGRRGLRLTLCSGTNEFMATLERDRVKLELIRLDGQRVPLAEGGAASQAVWDRFAQVVREMEDK